MHQNLSPLQDHIKVYSKVMTIFLDFLQSTPSYDWGYIPSLSLRDMWRGVHLCKSSVYF